MQARYRSGIISFILTTALLPVCCTAALAGTANGLLSALQSSKAAGTASLQVFNAHHEVIVRVFADGMSDKQCLDRAGEIAKCITSQCSQEQALSVWFVESSGRFKQVDFTSTQLKQLRSNEVGFLSTLVLTTGDQTSGSSTSAAATAAFVAPAASSTAQVATPQATASAAAQVVTGAIQPATQGHKDYSTERAALAKRLEALRAQNVGITPFVTQLTKIDDHYTHGMVPQALSELEDLSTSMGAQEKVLNDKKAALAKRNAPAVAAGPGVMGGTTIIGPGRGTGAATITTSSGTINMPSISEYGDITDYVQNLLGQAVGSLVPVKGPFLTERIQCAVRIMELQRKGVSTQGYISMYHRVEDEVKDCNTNPTLGRQLAGDVRYMQSQLGLGDMKGSITKLRTSIGQ